MLYFKYIFVLFFYYSTVQNYEAKELFLANENQADPAQTDTDILKAN